DPNIVLPLLANDDRLDDFRQLLDLAIDFSGTDAYAPRIEGRIRSPVDDESAMRSHFAVIAVTPHAGEALEVCRPIAGAVGIVPEADGHRGEGGCASELAFFAVH